MGEATLVAFDALAGRLKAAGLQVVRSAALIVDSEGSSRTPVRTGTLRRSWKVEVRGVFAEVAPTTVYARRVELGFVGADSLGRVYNQAGKPYVRPGYEAAVPKIETIARRLYARALGG